MSSSLTPHGTFAIKDGTLPSATLAPAGTLLIHAAAPPSGGFKAAYAVAANVVIQPGAPQS